jgi:hypothetical protein
MRWWCDWPSPAESKDPSAPPEPHVSDFVDPSTNRDSRRSHSGAACLLWERTGARCRCAVPFVPSVPVVPCLFIVPWRPAVVRTTAQGAGSQRRCGFFFSTASGGAFLPWPCRSPDATCRVNCGSGGLSRHGALRSHTGVCHAGLPPSFAKATEGEPGDRACPITRYGWGEERDDLHCTSPLTFP